MWDLSTELTTGIIVAVVALLGAAVPVFKKIMEAWGRMVEAKLNAKAREFGKVDKTPSDPSDLKARDKKKARVKNKLKHTLHGRLASEDILTRASESFDDDE